MVKLAQRIQKVKPSPTLAIDTKAKAMKAEGIDVVGFGAGEPDFDTPEHIKQAAIDALHAGKTKYTPVGGVNELKDAILAKLKRDNGLTYTRDEILVSCGGKHSLYNIAQVLLEAGDEVIIPAPYWVSYPDQVLLNDAKPVVVETKEENGFKITPQELEKAITSNTKAFVLNSPSNPTGGAYTRSELEAIAEVLVRKNVVCISDEIYEKIVYDGFEFVSIASLNDKIKALTITVNGASKVYSMTGWRMGYAAGPKEIIGAMTKLQGQVTTNINSMTQWAVVAALNQSQDFLKDWVKEFQRRRDYIVKRFNGMPGITCYNPQGAFYVFPNISSYLGKSAGGKKIETDSAFCEYLLEKHLVACVAGSGFGAPGYMRLSYATSMANIEKGLDRIEKALKDFA
ncbi:MAG: pyridoxal phosphate-dependent aminotransferase [Deltaproteobacteria bacterium]|nr:pyridoxal phosphate-dependent aminotransferase [Deltaproteobacteria bacterium]